MKESVLITGCAGFIGSSLARALLDTGWNVRGIDNFDPYYDRRLKMDNLAPLLLHDRFSFYEADVTKDNIPLADISLVVHLAALPGVRSSVSDPSGYFHVNMYGTQRLLHYAAAAGVRKVIFGSSSSIYGNCGDTRFSEDGCIPNPLSPYAFTKLYAEKLMHKMHNTCGMSVICLRLFSVYGPCMRPDLAIDLFSRALHNKQSVRIFGDGSALRDYTYIDDAVQGFIKALDYLLCNDHVNEVFNIGTGSPVSVMHVLDSIAGSLGVAAPVTCQPANASESLYTCADITKASLLLGYKPRYSFSQGLKKYLEWHLQREAEKIPAYV
jgi:UDP-glucuronate 4-epimerase